MVQSFCGSTILWNLHQNPVDIEEYFTCMNNSEPGLVFPDFPNNRYVKLPEANVLWHLHHTWAKTDPGGRWASRASCGPEQFPAEGPRGPRGPRGMAGVRDVKIGRFIYKWRFLARKITEWSIFQHAMFDFYQIHLSIIYINGDWWLLIS